MSGTATSTLARSAVIAALAVTLVLIAAKAVGWLMTGSVALLASLLDSTVDLAASCLALLAMRLAARPADRGHRFGHGKAEPLAAVAQAGFLIASAIAICLQSAQRLVDPQPVQDVPVGIGVTLLSLTLTVLLTLWQRHVHRRTGSLIVAADRANYTGDVALNLAVLLALGLNEALPGWPMDALLSLPIAGLLAFNAFAIGRAAVDVLMDKELPEAERAAIRQCLEDEPECHGMHDLRTRSAGGRRFIEFHMEMDGQMSLHDAHAVADRVEKRLRQRWPEADIVVHQEPAGLEDERLDHRLVRRRS